jgi:hypothetical protein
MSARPAAARAATPRAETAAPQRPSKHVSP